MSVGVCYPSIGLIESSTNLLDFTSTSFDDRPFDNIFSSPEEDDTFDDPPLSLSFTSSSSLHLRRKQFSEVHLKVSTIRDSKSDDKRFSIFTGTKRLLLRAEIMEDQMTWMEALQVVKICFLEYPTAS